VETNEERKRIKELLALEDAELMETRVRDPKTGKNKTVSMRKDRMIARMLGQRCLEGDVAAMKLYYEYRDGKPGDREEKSEENPLKLLLMEISGTSRGLPNDPPDLSQLKVINSKGQLVKADDGA